MVSQGKAMIVLYREQTNKSQRPCLLQFANITCQNDTKSRRSLIYTHRINYYENKVLISSLLTMLNFYKYNCNFICFKRKTTSTCMCLYLTLWFGLSIQTKRTVQSSYLSEIMKYFWIKIKLRILLRIYIFFKLNISCSCYSHSIIFKNQYCMHYTWLFKIGITKHIPVYHQIFFFLHISYECFITKLIRSE